MFRKLLVTLAVFALVGGMVFAAGFAADSRSSVRPLTAQSVCPVAGCTLDGACHDYAGVPEPDGAHEMACPEASCASVECHAWDSLSGRYHQASDASLNVWIIAPVVLVLLLVFVAKKAR